MATIAPTETVLIQRTAPIFDHSAKIIERDYGRYTHHSLEFASPAVTATVCLNKVEFKQAHYFLSREETDWAALWLVVQSAFLREFA